MRWLMIALFASLAALLLAAAGVARHIWLQHARIGSKPSAGAGQALDSTSRKAEEPNVEREI
jgi:hypothetical protein